MRSLVLITLAALATPAAATDFTVVHQSIVDGVRYLHVQTADVDGDGAPDMSVIRITCSGDALSSAAVYAPRDAASGLATGKRMHKPFTIVKEWGAPPTALTGRKGSWDLATMKGARSSGGVMAMDDWQQVTVSGLSEACDSKVAGGKASVSDLSLTK